MAENEDERLVGEAFNVAPSFFHGKKTAMLKKLWTPENKTARKLILANEDAVGESYGPQLKPTEHMVLVDVFTGSAKMWPAEAVVRVQACPINIAERLTSPPFGQTSPPLRRA